MQEQHRTLLPLQHTCLSGPRGGPWTSSLRWGVWGCCTWCGCDLAGHAGAYVGWIGHWTSALDAHSFRCLEGRHSGWLKEDTLDAHSSGAMVLRKTTVPGG